MIMETIYYPFFANYNTGRIYNAKIIIGPVKKDEHIFLKEGLLSDPIIPWEQRFDNGYPHVFYDEENQEYRCYYSSFISDEASNRYSLKDRIGREYDFHKKDIYPPRVWSALMARSKDGLVWERPSLGACEFNGNKNNNIVMSGWGEVSVFKDLHEEDPSRRYKMIGRRHSPGYIAVSFSPDGIHFCDPIEVEWIGEGLTPMGDTNNYAFWDETTNTYALITRTWEARTLRISNRCESHDFIHWTRPKEIYRGDGYDDQLYAMPVFKRSGLYLGLGSIFHGGDRSSPDFDRVDCELLYSLDCWHFNRVANHQPLIKHGDGEYGSGVPDLGTVYASPPVEIEGKNYIYYIGSNGPHTNYREGSLLRVAVDLDKLAGYVPQDNQEAVISTCDVKISGNKILVKADIHENGDICACITSLSSFYGSIVPIEGFDYKDSRLEIQTDGSYEVEF
jgi:hypothetical protein